MAPIVLTALLVIGLLITLSSLDDAFVDVLSLRAFRRKAARAPTAADANTSTGATAPADAASRPSIGVFVANWHEEDVLARMVAGNLARIAYRPLTLYLGVYPNDTATRVAAEKLAIDYPDNVRVVVNRLEGPTSKGQMLNEMFEVVFGNRATSPDLVVLHDSEDIIDPRSPAVYAAQSKVADFIQIPVFSLESTDRSLTAGTYMEEFAERHMGEMLLRDAVGAVIPSAGVGTCLTRRLVEHMLARHGRVLMHGCVTEDYILGAEVHRDGFKSTFAVIQAPPLPTEPSDRPSIVATREYFPRGFWASIKQKTRWTFGIAFEGTRRLGWRGSAWDIYFFYRDRKGAITNLLPIASMALLLMCIVEEYVLDDLPDRLETLFLFVIVMNSIAMLWRFAMRLLAFHEVHGRWDVIGVLVRWLVAIVVNAWAVLRAWRLFLGPSRLATRPITWSKTAHELPDEFAGEGPAAAGPVGQGTPLVPG